MLAKRCEVPGQLGRGRGLDLDTVASERMAEAEPGRVQELAAERRVRGSVDGVADDGKVDCSEVDSDLVRPSRLEPHAKECVFAEQLDHLEVRDRVSRSVGLQ